MRLVEGGLVAVAMAGLAFPRALQAQVGLASHAAQIALEARVAPLASIPAVGPTRRIGSQSRVVEASVKVRFATNTAYRLVVLGSLLDSGLGSRVWVRAADGDFQELTPGSAVTVARGRRSAGQWEREVSYRIESAGKEGTFDLPVRYEVVLDPEI